MFNSHKSRPQTKTEETTSTIRENNETVETLNYNSNKDQHT